MAATKLLVLLAALGVAANAHPISGVISMLQDLEVQSKEEGAAEAALFQKFTYWCKTSSTELNGLISKEKANIAELTDKIEGLKTDQSVLTEEIAQLTSEIEKMNSAAAKAGKVRDDEIALYKSGQDNFDGTVSAVDTAIDTMEESEDTALVQKGKKAAPAKPDAQTYQFKSGSIIETFKGMNTEFEGEKLDAQQAETNKQNAYNLAKQARDSAISAATDSKTEKESINGDKGSDEATATSDKASEQTALVDDSTSLDNTNKECELKNQEWETRSATRNAEIEAIQMAQKILSKVTGVRNPDEHEIAQKALIESRARIEQDTSLIKAETGVVSFLQVVDPKAKAVNLLREAAKAGHSKALQDLAEQLRTYEGPFDKVNGMIQKMIFRLMSEQKDEDDHKNWCDLETEKNLESKEDKRAKIEEMTASVTQLNAAISLLTEKITENDAKVNSITGYQATEKALREENHKENLITIKDSQDAQAAVAEATAVLKDFYKKSGEVQKEPWEFLQTGSKIPSSPDTWDSSYSGVADPDSNGGVLTLLDGVMQKFSTMEADATAADETDALNFDKDMSAKKIDLETTRQDTQMKTSKRTSMTEKMEGVASQKKSESAEHAAVDQYLKDLEPACGVGDSSYGDRKQARADEITALRKAQGILTEAFRAKGFLQK